MFNDPNSLKFPVLLVRPRGSREASEGRLASLPFGLGGGLRDRVRLLFRRAEESSEDIFLALTVGMGGGASVGD